MCSKPNFCSLALVSIASSMCHVQTRPVSLKLSSQANDDVKSAICRWCSLSRGCTIWSDTGTQCLPSVVRPVFVAGWKGSRTWCRQITRSWRGVVTRGLPLLWVSRSWPWVLKRIHRRQMVEVTTPMAAATRAGRCPACSRPMTLSLSLVLSLDMVVSRKGLFS